MFYVWRLSSVICMLRSVGICFLLYIQKLENLSLILLFAERFVLKRFPWFCSLGYSYLKTLSDIHTCFEFFPSRYSGYDVFVNDSSKTTLFGMSRSTLLTCNWHIKMLICFFKQHPAQFWMANCYISPFCKKHLMS